MIKRKTIFTIISLLLVAVLLSFYCCFSYIYSNNVFSALSIPNAYYSVLVKFHLVIDGIFSESFERDYNNGKFSIILTSKELEYKWNSMILDINDNMDNASSESFGYILKDINDDSVDELFLVRNDQSILAIFTIVDKTPCLLDAFWSKNKCVILDNYNIYTLTSSGAEDFEYATKKMNNKGDGLVVIKSFGCTDGNYFINENNKKKTIAYSEFETLLLLNPFKNSDSWHKLGDSWKPLKL